MRGDVSGVFAAIRGAIMKENWIRCSERLPDNGVVVETKIDDFGGVRNVQLLKRNGRLWFFPDGRMYVYYEPTHWRPQQ